MQKIRRYLGAVAKAPYWMVLDRIDRARFNRSFYRSYRGLSGREIVKLCQACFEGVQLRRMVHETVRRLEEHRNRGHKILLVSGSLDFILRPLARYLGADVCLCPSLVEAEGVFSGELNGDPVIGKEKARLVLEYARDHGIDPAGCYAYADSVSDLPILESVGHPVVVLSGRRLRRIAVRRGWEILG